MKIICIILFIFIYHLFIQNGIEKLITKTFIEKTFIKRPLFKEDKFNKLCHIGMPSGHAEIITIICCLLYNYNYINLQYLLIIIAIISLQRVISKRHTFIQIIFGIIFGLLYSLLYIKLPLLSVILVLLFGLLLLKLTINKYDVKVKKPIPKWVNNCMISNINKKQNINFIYKLPLFYYNCINQDSILYISWKELENYLDIIINKIKNTNIKFDAIVGIKTGGAIISDYISNKLGLLNYKIKIVRKEYNNNKSEKDTLYDFYQKIILKNYGKYIISEGINDNIEGKNIILIDELINTGVTMYKAYKYLKNKKANIINSYCISFMNNDKKFNMSKCKLDYATTDKILVWPWGYDN